MTAQQLARGLWTGFDAQQDPFQLPNGMQENLRIIDDALGLYTLQPPQAVGTPKPIAPADGDGQIYEDGSYAVFNAGTWKEYAPRVGVKAVLRNGKDVFLSTETGGWASMFSHVGEKLSGGDGADNIGFGSVTAGSKLREIASIIDHGGTGDGVTDDRAALLAARPWVHLPRLNGQPTTYFISSLNIGDLDNVSISADEGVTLSVPQNAPYEIFTGLNAVTRVHLYARDIGMPYVIAPAMRQRSTADTESALRPSAIRSNTKQQKLDSENVTCIGVGWPGQDEWQAAGTTLSEFAASFANDASYTNSWRGAFVDIGPYETVSASHVTASASVVRGVVVRGTDGFVALFSAGGTSDYLLGTKLKGQALVEKNLTWAFLGQDIYSSFAAENSRWSITRTDAKTAVVKLNGKAITLPTLTDVGDIQDVGFVCFGSAAFAVEDMSVERRIDAVYSNQMLSEIRIFGDSTAADLPGSFAEYLPGLIDGKFGISLKSVSNYAVVGHSSAQQLAVMNEQGFGAAFYVILCVGTNDIQGQTPIDVFRATYTSLLQNITGAGRVPVVVVPWMFYTRAQTGGIGQQSSNYEKGYRYRGVIEVLAAKFGAIVVNTPEQLPNPDPRLVTELSDFAMLRDNIHQGARGHQLYAAAISQAILDHYCAQPEAVSTSAVELGAGVTSSDFNITIEKSGKVNLSGTLLFSAAPSNSVVAMQLPRWARPRRSFNTVLTALTDSTMNSCYAFIQSDGAVSIPLVPAGATVFVLTASFHSV